MVKTTIVINTYIFNIKYIRYNFEQIPVHSMIIDSSSKTIAI